MSERENHERDPREMEPDYLVELALQLHARACNPACSEALHDRANELKHELERRCERARIAEQEKRELVEALEKCVEAMEDSGAAWVDPSGLIESAMYKQARALLAKHEERADEV